MCLLTVKEQQCRSRRLSRHRAVLASTSPTHCPVKAHSSSSPLPALSLHTRRWRSVPHRGTACEALPLHQEFKSRPPEYLFSISTRQKIYPQQPRSQHLPSSSSHPWPLLLLFSMQAFTHQCFTHLWPSNTVHKLQFLLLPPCSTPFDSLACLLLSRACLLPHGTEPAAVGGSLGREEGDSTHAVCSSICETRNWEMEPLKISVSKHAEIDNI